MLSVYVVNVDTVGSHLKFPVIQCKQSLITNVWAILFLGNYMYLNCRQKRQTSITFYAQSWMVRQDIPSQAIAFSRSSSPEESEENRFVFSAAKPAGLRNAVSICCLNSSASSFLVQHSLCTSQ